MRLYLIAILLFSCFVAAAQQVSGYVYDEAENLPLQDANVYIDGTTIGTVTDDRGYFKLTIPEGYTAPLVITFVGFETLKIENPLQYKRSLKVMLRESSTMLAEVIIDKNPPFTRKQMLRAFRRQFLGTSRNGTSCKIENEDDITLRYDTRTNMLYATAQKPLRIKNRQLEYDVQFNLMYFEVGYNRQSLEDWAIERSFYAGTTFFTDVSRDGSADKKRKEAYLGSVTHLMHTIANNSWSEDKFTLYYKSFPIAPQACLTVTDTLDYKKVTLKLPEEADNVIVIKQQPGTDAAAVDKAMKERQKEAKKFLSVTYNSGLQSAVFFEEERFIIDKSGLFSPITALTFGGHMAKLRAGDLLPLDYKVKD